MVLEQPDIDPQPSDLVELRAEGWIPHPKSCAGEIGEVLFAGSADIPLLAQLDAECILTEQDCSTLLLYLLIDLKEGRVMRVG